MMSAFAACHHSIRLRLRLCFKEHGAEVNLTSREKEEAGTWLAGRRQHLAHLNKAGVKHRVVTSPGGKRGNAVCKEQRALRVLGGRCLSQRAGRDFYQSSL